MTKSALQIARAAYQPKVPAALKGAVKAVDGEYTQSVADQEEIKKLFPNTYGMPLIQFVEGEAKEFAPMNVGVILSGGQAPGGHNVISGLFDGIKKMNPANMRCPVESASIDDMISGFSGIRLPYKSDSIVMS